MGCGALFGAGSSESKAGPASEPPEIPETVVIDEADADGIQDESVPSYWTNKKHADKSLFSQMVYTKQADHAVFDQILKSSYEAKSTKDRPCPKSVEPCERQSQGCPCVRVDGTPGLPTGFCVRRVVRVENSNMWGRYAQKRKAILASRAEEKLRGFDPALQTSACVGKSAEVFDACSAIVNEGYLWHGTHVRTALSIAQQDFDMGKAGSGRGAMYGPGAYFAESCTKADEYAFDEPGGYYDGIHALLLCRVCMGKMYYTTKFGQEDAYDKVKAGDFDSVLADLARHRKTFREFVVYNADQIYPEYVVLYQRIHKADDVEKVHEIAATPYHLELPVYWRNCHRVPKQDAFNEQCRIKSTTCALLQRLVTACAEDQDPDQRVFLQSAQRIENSYLLNQYVDFKESVRKYLTGDVPQPALSTSRKCISVNEIDKGAGNTSVTTSRFLKNEGSDFVEASISVDNLDLPLNEHLLWYGASADEVRDMARNGLDMARGSNNPAFVRYGKGLYFSDVLANILQYADEDEDGVKHLLLCRVCCGEVFYTEQDELLDGDTAARSARKHSVLAKPLVGPREFVVLENTQAYPEFILQVKLGPFLDLV